MADVPPRKGGTGPQLLGSLAVAVLIVAVAIWAVTARLGPTSITELEAAEDRAEEAGEAAEEKQEAEEEKAGDSGGGRRRRGRDR
jgi:hypothetical protein